MTIIHGINVDLLPRRLRNNPEKLGALLLAEKCYLLNKRVEKLEDFLLVAGCVCSEQIPSKVNILHIKHEATLLLNSKRADHGLA